MLCILRFACEIFHPMLESGIQNGFTEQSTFSYSLLFLYVLQVLVGQRLQYVKTHVSHVSPVLIILIRGQRSTKSGMFKVFLWQFYLLTAYSDQIRHQLSNCKLTALIVKHADSLIVISNCKLSSIVKLADGLIVIVNYKLSAIIVKHADGLLVISNCKLKM